MATLAAMLREIAILCQAVALEGVATGGSTTTLIDTVHLAGFADDVWNEHQLYIWKGTGLGQQRRITDFANAGDTLTFGVGTAPISDSEYLILEPGWQMQTIRTAFLMALRQRRHYYMLPVVDESLTLANSGGVVTYEYNVPSGIDFIEKIIKANTAGASDFWTPIPAEYWYIQRASTKQIVLEKTANDYAPWIGDGYKIQLVGQKYETEPTADSSTVSIVAASLQYLAASIALQTMRSRDVQNSKGYAAQANILYQQYLTSRGDEETVVNPGSRSVNV